MKEIGEMIIRIENGFIYFNNGDRMMGDYYNDNPIGKHVILTKNGEVKIENK